MFHAHLRHQRGEAASCAAVLRARRQDGGGDVAASCRLAEAGKGGQEAALGAAALAAGRCEGGPRCACCSKPSKALLQHEMVREKPVRLQVSRWDS